MPDFTGRGVAAGAHDGGGGSPRVPRHAGAYGSLLSGEWSGNRIESNRMEYNQRKALTTAVDYIVMCTVLCVRIIYSYSIVHASEPSLALSPSSSAHALIVRQPMDYRASSTGLLLDCAPGCTVAPTKSSSPCCVSWKLSDPAPANSPPW
jgi:hypothetical protein